MRYQIEYKFSQGDDWETSEFHTYESESYKTLKDLIRAVSKSEYGFNGSGNYRIAKIPDSSKEVLE